jgi:hypothetical protein
MSFLGIAGELRRLNSFQTVGAPVLLPLCHNDRFFRLWWPRSGSILLVAPLLILIGTGVLRRNGFAIPFAVTAGICLAVLCILFWLVVRSLRIRAANHDLTHVVLVGVAPAFVEACEAIDDREADRVGESLSQMFGEQQTE